MDVFTNTTSRAQGFMWKRRGKDGGIMHNTKETVLDTTGCVLVCIKNDQNVAYKFLIKNGNKEHIDCKVVNHLFKMGVWIRNKVRIDSGLLS